MTPAIALPTQKTAPRTALRDLSILLYGPSKVGKSTFGSQAPDALFLATEPGLSALEVFQIPITSWEEFLSACGAIEAGEHPFKTIVVDTVDNLHRLIVDHTRAKLGIVHESDLGFGKAYGLINGELHRVLSKLAFLPYGLILVSHSEDREMTTRTGRVTRTVPSLPEKARRIVLDLVDIIGFCDLVEDTQDGRAVVQRVIRTKPNPRYEAGDRTGRLPGTLELDYQRFQDALEGRSP
jgi:hypothetical protein